MITLRDQVAEINRTLHYLRYTKACILNGVELTEDERQEKIVLYHTIHKSLNYLKAFLNLLEAIQGIPR